MDADAAARQAYAEAGHSPGKRAGASWWGRVCHAHRVAYPSAEDMGPHLDRDHAQPQGYYSAGQEAA